MENNPGHLKNAEQRYPKGKTSQTTGKNAKTAMLLVQGTAKAQKYGTLDTKWSRALQKRRNGAPWIQGDPDGPKNYEIAPDWRNNARTRIRTGDLTVSSLML